MKKLVKSIFAVAVAMTLASCAGLGTVAGTGALYTDLAQGEMVTANTLGSKVGTSEAVSYLGLIATGDASIQTAARSAGIKKISHVDSKKSSILGIINTHTTVVYGE
ncbi:MAG: hypothetical protein E7087_02735 [Bacteroidales bacterium]|nr:hypothetical protein [Bacteroidales bacterium]